ncbi:MAG: flagellar hook-basal body complex protein FliE [Burkholderiales bacterium]|nr:flagellar hook-basal body complex protein FliE [Burkholderiales bacterium]
MSPIERVQLSMIPAARAAAPSAAPGFADALKGALESVSRAQAQAAQMARRLQENDPAVSLEQTMVAMAQANVSFQLLVQTRNRLVQAYQDIMNMPV